MIGTSHELSENDGLRRFAELLSGRFPDAQFRFYKNECVWEID